MTQNDQENFQHQHAEKQEETCMYVMVSKVGVRGQPGWGSVGGADVPSTREGKDLSLSELEKRMSSLLMKSL